MAVAHVFISYSSRHRHLTEKLAAFLEGCGLEVWWDRELAARGPFAGQIHERLRTAACVIVLWTAGAIKSDWVKAEADAGYDGGGPQSKLVSVTDEGIDWRSLPAPYNTFEHHRPFETELILRDVLAVREGRLLLEDKREELPAPDARTPTMLLQAKFGLVPFTGSNAMRDELLDWALARGPYASRARRDAGRLLHGPGGLGKTRLTIEVSEALRAQGWSAGFLARPGAGDQPGDTAETRTTRRERRAKALSHLIRGANDKGLLLVMDYSEGRDTEIKAIAAAIRTRPAEGRATHPPRPADTWCRRLVDTARRRRSGCARAVWRREA
jgi:hypothetical protein